MPTCPKCHGTFRVPPGDSAQEHGCPRCGPVHQPCIYCDDRYCFGECDDHDYETERQLEQAITPRYQE